ncbi:MAG: SH3 domain-containing protein [Clostridiaceae bacterium]|nr:SH3 domain-containing protein [Clostridiaceae bacterium]
MDEIKRPENEILSDKIIKPGSLEEGRSDKDVEQSAKIAIDRGLGQMPDLQDHESPKDLKGNPVYLDKVKRRIPPWLIAFVVFATLMAGLFLVVPQLVSRQPTPDITQPSDGTMIPGWEDHLADKDSAVVSASSAPLFAKPDGNSARVAEALFNEHVTVLDANSRDFMNVRLDDGVTGFIKRSYLTADTSLLSPEGCLARVVVRIPFKRVMSHASQGSLVIEAPMGSTFFADYRNGDLLRVRLPNGESGWINASGVLLLAPTGVITPGDDFHQLFIVTLMAFHDSPFVPGGVTARGISPEGALFVAGQLNGMNFARDRRVLMRQGLEVDLSLDAEGLPALASMAEGDIVFIHKKGDDTAIQTIGIRVDDDQLLIALANRSTFRVIDLASSEAVELASRVMAVRRLLAP